MEDKNSKSGDKTQESGTLYVVSTPIGNLDDITLRALKTLKNVDLIAAENVRHTKRLCSHYNIDTRLTSYNQHNQRKKTPELLGKLRSGLNIGLVTNAGTPIVSDPGSLLTSMAIESGIRISPIPGPSAVVCAISVCGLRAERFLFMGFLSNKGGKRRRELEGLKTERRTMVFYEAPHRIESMLCDLYEILGDRHIVILRELTKVYEEIKRGPVSSILREYSKEKIKGEFTIVVEGERNGNKNDKNLSINKRDKNRIKNMLKSGDFRVKEIAMELSRESGRNFRQVYKECLVIKRELME